MEPRNPYLHRSGDATGRDTPGEPFRYIDWLSVFHAAEGERAGSSPVP